MYSIRIKIVFEAKFEDYIDVPVVTMGPNAAHQTEVWRTSCLTTSHSCRLR